MQFIIREVATGFPLYHLWLSSRYPFRFAFALHPTFLHLSVCTRASTSETSVHVVSPMLRWWIFHHRYLQRFNGHRAVVLVAISTSALIGLAVAIPTWWMNNFWCAVASTIFHWSYLFISHSVCFVFMLLRISTKVDSAYIASLHMGGLAFHWSDSITILSSGRTWTNYSSTEKRMKSIKRGTSEGEDWNVLKSF